MVIRFVLFQVSVGRSEEEYLGKYDRYREKSSPAYKNRYYDDDGFEENIKYREDDYRNHREAPVPKLRQKYHEEDPRYCYLLPHPNSPRVNRVNLYKLCCGSTLCTLKTNKSFVLSQVLP